jgi:acetyltransferase
MEKNTPSTLPDAQDVRRYDLRALDALFAPKTVAVIGANEDGGIEQTVLSNLINHPFGGTVFAIHPRNPSILGLKTYSTIAATPDPIELAVIVSPAPVVPRIIGECVAAGVRGAIILSAGFRETGAPGAELEQEILAQARRGALRVIGPNSLGVMNTATGLNATLAKHMARRGHIAFLSQSGALGAAVLDWSLRENFGFSSFVSVGSMLDVGWGELIDYLADDPYTRSILVYMESLGDARAFLSAARALALTKPIIVLKAGRTAGAARAASSHTGALTGNDAALDAVVRRCGALRVDNLDDLFHMAEVLEKQPRPLGPRLTIITNAGGPGVIAAEALVAAGGELAELADETRRQLDQLLPPYWSHTNPIDILDDADAERYAHALEIVAKDPNADGFLAILTPQASAYPTETAERLTPYARRFGKPVLASWMGAEAVSVGRTVLNQASIPTFHYPDTAARMFGYMWRYTYNLRGIYETPTMPDDADGAPDRARAEQIIQSARASGRTLLTEFESKQLLACYHIPVVETRVAASEADAVQIAGELGYPVVLKLHSETIAHKMDVGGVELDLNDADAVRRAYRAIQARGGASFAGVTVQPMIAEDGYELIVGSNIDSQVGPILLFGAGGALVDVLNDTTFALPPLNTTLARRMIEQTRIYQGLQGARGRQPIDLAALETLLVRFSQLVVEQRWIKEIDVNPLRVTPTRALPHLQNSQTGEGGNVSLPQFAGLANGGGLGRGILALDASVVVFGLDTRPDDLPRLPMRLYPTQYVSAWTTKEGMPVTLRPIRPEDEPLMVAFHTTLSDRSVLLRYMHVLSLDQRIAHERLARICFDDYDYELALVVEHANPETNAREIIAVGRMSKLRRRNESEFAILVSDQYQGHGLGSELLARLIQIARDEKQERATAYIATENTPMLHLCQKFGFRLHRSLEESQVEAVLEL